MKASEMEQKPIEDSSNDGVTISEEFQKAAHGLVHKASKHELQHLRNKVSDREDTLHKETMSKMKKGPKGSVYPETMSSTGMP